MSERKLINVYVTHNRNSYTKIAIPYDIDEVQLKSVFRDLGHISSYLNSYNTTKVYLENDEKTNLTEICLAKFRSLESLGIVENSFIFIKNGEPEPRPIYRSPRNIRYLYGCPMSQSVEEAINQAEKYSDNDSTIISGSVSELD